MSRILLLLALALLSGYEGAVETLAVVCSCGISLLLPSSIHLTFTPSCSLSLRLRIFSSPWGGWIGLLYPMFALLLRTGLLDLPLTLVALIISRVFLNRAIEVSCSQSNFVYES